MYRIIGISPPRIAPARIGVAHRIAVAVLVGVERIRLLTASGEGVAVRKVPLVGLYQRARRNTSPRSRSVYSPAKPILPTAGMGLVALPHASRSWRLGVTVSGLKIWRTVPMLSVINRVWSVRSVAPPPLPNVMSRRAAYYCLDDTRQPMCSGMNITR